MIRILREGNAVRRYHTEERIKEETVGHHCANVCAILLRLEPTCSRELLVAALMHDMPEQYTGDIPAPVKREHPHLKRELAEAEEMWYRDNHLPPATLMDHEKDLLKLADCVDLVLSSLEEMGRGNMYARRVVQKAQEYIMAMPIYQDYMVKIELMIREVKDAWDLQTTGR